MTYTDAQLGAFIREMTADRNKIYDKIDEANRLGQIAQVEWLEEHAARLTKYIDNARDQLDLLLDIANNKLMEW